MVKFFKCEKCNSQCYLPASKVRPEMKCGAVRQYLFADNPEAGQDGKIESLGIKPIGCGGNMKEITQEEAMSYDPRK